MDADVRAVEVRAALTRLSTMRDDAAVVTANVLAIAALRCPQAGPADRSVAVTAAFAALRRALSDFLAESFVLLENGAHKEGPAVVMSPPAPLHLVEQKTDGAGHQASQ